MEELVGGAEADVSVRLHADAAERRKYERRQDDDRWDPDEGLAGRAVDLADQRRPSLKRRAKPAKSLNSSWWLVTRGEVRTLARAWSDTDARASDHLRCALQDCRTASRFIGDEPLTTEPARSTPPETTVRALRSLRARLLACCLPCCLRR